MNYSLFPNWKKGPFTDTRARQAVNAAINRGELTAVLSARQKSATSVLGSTTPGYTDQSDLLRHHPDTADRLLGEAGWTGRDDDGFSTKDGKRLVIPVGYWQTAPFLELVQQQLRAVGVDLRLEKKTMAETSAAHQARTNDVEFHNLTRSDPDVLRTVFDADGRNVNNRPAGRVDDLLRDSLATTDTGARTGTVSDITARLVTDGNVIPLVELSGISATAPDVHGYRYEASSRLQLVDTWLSEGA